MSTFVVESGPPDPALVFADSPDEEHRRILASKTSTAEAAWELGSRLVRMRDEGIWQQVTPRQGELPFEDFTDYLTRGVDISRSSAYRYMDASTFPLWCSRRFTPERIAWLRKIVDLTAVEESVDEAIALELPTKTGPTKPFQQMTTDEVEAAYVLMRDGTARVKRPGRPAGATGAAAATQKRAADAAAPWLKPRQVRAREAGGHVVLDVTGVPEPKASEVFAALASALR